MLKVVSTSILTIYNFDRCGSTRMYEFPFPGHLWQKYVNTFVRYRTRLELRVGLAGSRGGYEREPPGRAAGERQIRNEFFCFEAPRKTSNAKENDSRLLPDGGEPRRAARRVAERRGKRAKRPFASAKPFLQPCMQPPRESQTWHTPIRAGPRACKIRNGARTRTRARVRGDERARAREYKVLFSKFMIVNKF